ncbi:MAG: hypothetical protein K0R51_1288 [Cytophagaceae bacterium]|jgi:hypothetical protein|nr:hypothetical protein [Cytophagaceae bacterium]
MRVCFLISFLVAIVFYSAQAQTIQDSLSTIERQRIELRDQQARLKAKQDSLVNERVLLERRQATQQQQGLQKQQEQLNAQPKQQIIYTYQQPSSSTILKREVKNIIGLAPLHIFITGVEVFYERSISKHSSLQWNVGYHNMDYYPETDNNGNVNTYNSSSDRPAAVFLTNRNKVASSGIRVQMQYKSYLFQEAGALRKLHIGPSLLYKQDELTIMTNYNNSSYSSYTPIYEQFFAQALTGAVDVGYNIHFLRYFSVDPFVGFSYTVPLTGKAEVNKVHVDFLNPYKQGLILRTGVTIGYTF